MVLHSGDGATLEGVTVTGGSPGYMMIPPTCVTGQGGDGIVVRDCHVESIAIAGGRGHVVARNVVAGGNGCLAHRRVGGATWRQPRRTPVALGAGIEISGGADHVIAETEEVS